MGLAAPRKRVKISHDPRNLHWLSAGSDTTTNGGSSGTTTSFGKRLMQRQGWQQGQALGSRPANAPSDLDAQRLAAAKVGVIVKDDTLGLGAQLRSKDVAHQKTGLDAFQGLLGRLNARDQAELEAVERKEDDRKLEMYAKGRWGGGVVFVRGGLLVPHQEDLVSGGKEQQQMEKKEEEEEEEEKEENKNKKVKKSKDDKKKEKREKKEKSRDEKKKKKKEKKEASDKPEPSRGEDKEEEDEEEKEETPADVSKKTTKQKKEKAEKKRRRSSTAGAEQAASPSLPHPPKKQVVPLSNGRHLLRGRNIEAKRKAFSDAKGLDAIFMKTTATTS